MLLEQKPNIDTSYLHDQLVQAIFFSDLEEVEKLIDNGADVNIEDSFGTFPIQVAAFMGKNEIIKLLLKKNAKIDITNENNTLRTALMIAAKEGNKKSVEILLNAANSELKDENGNTAFMLAAENGHHEILKLFFYKSWKGINNINNSNETALTMAAKNKHFNAVKALIDAGADVNVQDNNGNTALIHAAANGHIDAIRLLINHRANITAINTDRHTALMAAAANGHSKAINLLVKNGAEVNAQDNNAVTALMFAAADGHIDAITVLIEHGAEINAQNNDRNTALMFAATSGHIDAITALIEHGAEINAQNNDGETALMHAAVYDHSEAIMALIEHGAEINAQNNDGETALIMANNVNHLLDAVEILNHYPRFLEECSFFLKELNFNKKAIATLRELFNNCEDENKINAAIQKIKATVGAEMIYKSYGRILSFKRTIVALDAAYSIIFEFLGINISLPKSLLESNPQYSSSVTPEGVIHRCFVQYFKYKQEIILPPSFINFNPTPSSALTLENSSSSSSSLDATSSSQKRLGADEEKEPQPDF